MYNVQTEIIRNIINKNTCVVNIGTYFKMNIVDFYLFNLKMNLTNNAYVMVKNIITIILTYHKSQFKKC